MRKRHRDRQRVFRDRQPHKDLRWQIQNPLSCAWSVHWRRTSEVLASRSSCLLLIFKHSRSFNLKKTQQNWIKKWRHFSARAAEDDGSDSSAEEDAINSNVAAVTFEGCATGRQAITQLRSNFLASSKTSRNRSAPFHHDIPTIEH